MSAATRDIRIVACGDSDRRWDNYVDRHEKGSVFHTRQMVRVYEATPNYEPFAIAAANGDGQILAMLVAVRISTVAGLASTFTSRSIWYAEPLCDTTPEAQLALADLIRHHDTHNRGRTLFAEVRPLMVPASERDVLASQDYEYKAYLNYVVDTTPDSEELWKGLSKSGRKKINRTMKRGVTVEVDNTHAGVATMYQLVRESYQRSKVPLADPALFHAAMDELPPGVVQVRLARFEGNAVAGGIGLAYGDRFYAWYGGSVRISGLTPFDYLTWDEICWSSKQGLKYYDFGGAGAPDEEYGPRDFKAKFGGELVSYGRYRKVFSGAKLAIAEKGYQLLRSFIFPKHAK